MNYILYRHIRKDKDEVFYIGIGKPSRAYDFKQRNTYWKRIFDICNEDIEVEILFDDLTWEQACEKEKWWISLYGRSNLGKGTLCNLTDGGEGAFGCKQMKEAIAKRVAKRIGIPLSEEHKEKIRQSQIGEKNHRFGKKASKETREKMSSIRKGHLTSEETKIKISIAQKGKPRNSEEAKRYLSMINSGVNHPQFGKQRSQETKEKIRQANTGRKAFGKNIQVIDTSTDIIYHSITEAAKVADWSRSNFHYMIYGKRENKTTFKLIT